MMTHHILRHVLAITICMLWHALMYGNNIQVSNVSLTSQNTTDHFTMVKFDISWENSWRVVGGPANWDAAWVFVKYRVGAGPWLHAWINNTGHTAPSGSAIDVGLLDPGSAFNAMTNPGMGVFIHRSGPGSGSFSLTNVQLRWNYGDNGLSDNEQVDIKVFAIEHVYVPQGAFYVGSGGSELGTFFEFDAQGNPPYQVQSEAAIDVGGGSNDIYYYNDTGMCGDQDGPIPASFPKGFNDYYIMKYELSQQGYVDFLNTLNRTQQLANIYASFTYQYGWAMSNFNNNPQARNGIRFPLQFYYYGTETPAPFFCDLNANDKPGDPNDGRDLPCNNFKWSYLAAYMDWAGLRPITELEYEKAARGNQTPVPNEYAWGTNSFFPRKGYINAGTSEELPSNPDANMCSEFDTGVNFLEIIRCGAFATPDADRVKAGAGYYGAMELSGNVLEITISVGKPQGRIFDGRHGDGILTTNGNANVTNWPDNATAVGAGLRGGSWSSLNQNEARTSDRSSAAFMQSYYQVGYGCRGGRTAPN